MAYAPGYFVPKKGGRPEISWQADSTKALDEVALEAGETKQVELKLDAKDFSIF